MDPIVVAVLGWTAAWVLWGRPRRLRLDDREPASTSAPRTYVVIPARDEAAVLPGLLGDLTADPDQQRTTIVIDDNSSDGTGDRAREHADTTVALAQPLPAGWVGKCWACHTGVDAARRLGAVPDDVLVFLDADVRLAPGALAAATDVLDQQGGGVVSVQPFHTTVRPDEQCSLFPGLVSVLATGVGRRTRPPDGVFGPLLATSLGDYDAVGGHAAVRGEVTEDLALGHRYRDAGLPVSVQLGADLVRFRMYPQGVRQLIEGWTKNMATGAGAVPLVRTLGVFLWIVAAGSAAMSLPLVPGNSQVAPAVGAALYVAFVIQMWILGRALGTFGPVTALLYPLPLVAFMVLFARSAWRLHVRRSVTWRDRTIRLGDAGPTP